jgi:tetratricopeptide (TPR) repeat protein
MPEEPMAAKANGKKKASKAESKTMVKAATPVQSKSKTAAPVQAKPTSKLKQLFADMAIDALRAMPEEDLEGLLDAAAEGISTYAEANGISRDTLAAMVNNGNMFYEKKMYQEAAAIFGLVATMDTSFGPAWRGLGATLHALHQYTPAATCYQLACENAAKRNETDLASQILWGECLVLSGEREAGFAILNESVQKAKPSVQDMPYVQRAKVVLSNGTQQAKNP